MWPLFEQSLQRYRELEQLLADPAVVADRVRYTRIVKEHGSLARQVKPYLEFREVEEHLRQAEAMATAESDADMKAYAEQEANQLRERRDALRVRLEEILLAGGE